MSEDNEMKPYDEIVVRYLGPNNWTWDIRHKDEGFSGRLAESHSTAQEAFAAAITYIGNG